MEFTIKILIYTLISILFGVYGLVYDSIPSILVVCFIAPGASSIYEFIGNLISEKSINIPMFIVNLFILFALPLLLSIGFGYLLEHIKYTTNDVDNITYNIPSPFMFSIVKHDPVNLTFVILIALVSAILFIYSLKENLVIYNVASSIPLSTFIPLIYIGLMIGSYKYAEKYEIDHKHFPNGQSIKDFSIPLAILGVNIVSLTIISIYFRKQK
jgi:hypothetical protein